MKLHISKTTISCPKGFVFSLFRPYWSFSQNHTLRLDCCAWWKLQHGNIKSVSVKDLLWNDARALLYQQVPLTPTELPGHLGLLRTCCSSWSLLKGLWGSDSGTERAVCHGTAAPCPLACSTFCIWPPSAWEQKPSDQPHFAVSRREGSLHCALLKNKCTARKVPTLFFMCFSPSDKAWGCFRSSRCDPLWQAGPELRGTATMHLLVIAIPLAMCMC